MITHSSDHLELKKQMDEMWEDYEAEKITERKPAEQRAEEMRPIEKDKTIDNEEEDSSTVEDLDFASAADIHDIINEEIEQKQEWAQANTCRAYIDSTF